MTKWNWNEPLTEEFATHYRTRWEALDLPQTEKRLHRLYDLRNFAGLCGAEVPRSWRQLLAEEIDRGERRQAALVFREAPLVEEISVEAETEAGCDATRDADSVEDLFGKTAV